MIWPTRGFRFPVCHIEPICELHYERSDLGLHNFHLVIGCTHIYPQPHTHWHIQIQIFSSPTATYILLCWFGLFNYIVALLPAECQHAGSLQHIRRMRNVCRFKLSNKRQAINMATHMASLIFLVQTKQTIKGQRSGESISTSSSHFDLLFYWRAPQNEAMMCR